MITLIYKYRSGTMETRPTLTLLGISGECSDDCKIHITGVGRAGITLGQLTLPLYNGIVRFPIHILPDGRYTPRLTVGKTVVEGTAFIKSGRSFQRTETDVISVFELAERISALEAHINDLTGDMGALNEKISTGRTFTLD